MLRGISLALLILVAALALVITPAAAARTFPETNFTVSNDKFVDYFDHRGGVRVLGYPISREFTFLGTRVQFFQRAVLQVTPDGGVGLLNILDEGLLPYTHINGSTFPGPDPGVIAAAPSPGDPDYGTKAIAFVREYAPDSWQGMKTNFFSAFSSTVRAEDAFPNGGDTGLLPLINLEIWGLPTSKPTQDPSNGNFVYLRFQRGIMQYDNSSGLTQGVLIGDYLKSVITGRNLPGDLAQDARGSKLYLQYNNGMVNGLNRPGDLPGTDMFAAFEQDGVVVPTPAPAAATPTVAPPTATPAVLPTPTAIAVTGSQPFIDQTNAALRLLAEKTPDAYAMVRRNVFRIDQTSGAPSYDVANRTLHPREADAFASNWHFNPDAQLEWYAGLIVHNAVLIQQGLAGQSPTSMESEYQARLQQKAVLSIIETDQPGGQLSGFVADAMGGKEAVFGDWEAPRDPLPTPTPTPGGD